MDWITIKDTSVVDDNGKHLEVVNLITDKSIFFSSIEINGSYIPIYWQPLKIIEKS